MVGKGNYLLVLFVVILALNLLTIQPVEAQVENVTTSCTIIVNDIIDGQPVTLAIQIYPAPPEGEVFSNISATIVSPLQGIWGNGTTGPWDIGNITTDSNGKATVNFDIPTFSGYWNAEAYFGGQYFANNTIHYQPCVRQINFHVSGLKTPSPAPTQNTTLSPSSNSSIAASPSVPEFSWLTILPLLLTIPIILVTVGK